MEKIIIISSVVVLMFCRCAQQHSASKGPVKNISTCILVGPESMTYYYGDSANQQELKAGSIYDHVFMSYVLTSIKKHSKDTSFKVVIKPLSSASVFENVVAVIDIFNANGIQNRYVNKENLAPPSSPYKLNMPSDDNDPNLNRKAKNTLTILLYAGDNIYAYEGKKMNKGTTYNFTNIGKFINEESKKYSGQDFIVIIKPSDDATYKNTVDILDEMKTNKIDRYALVDLSDAEVAFIKTLK